MRSMQWLKFSRTTVAPAGLMLAVLGVGSSQSRASDADAIRVLGFEAPIDWTVDGGTIVGSSAQRTQGNAALEVLAPGYVTLTSRLIGPLGEVSPRISFDLRIPGGQPNPYWFGAAQLLVSIPSLGLNNAYIGQRELTGLPLDAFTTLSFDVPSDILTKLRGSYFDATFSIVLNVPPGVSASYLVDNFQVSSTIPADSTIAHGDLPRILGFEQASDWTVASGTIIGTSRVNSTQGNFALGVQPAGYTTLTSLPLTSIAPLNETITLDVRLPAEQPNPTWFGTVQLYASLPSAGIYNAYVGEHELTGLAVEEFHTLEFELAEPLRTALNGATYSDLQLQIALNAPTPGAGIYYFDNIQVGPVTNPAEEAFSDLRMDIVGRSRSGVASIDVEGHGASPAVLDALFYIRSDDGNCVPSEFEVCRFVVNEISLKLGPFELDDHDFSGARVRTVRPFRVTLGGTYGLSAAVPESAQFITRAGDLLLPASSRNLTITINPAGDGFISLAGTISGSGDGHSFTLGLSLTADTPLANRPPLASAGADQTVTVTTGCVATATLDGSATVDPDGNLSRIAWLENGEVLRAVGTTVQVPLNERGPHIFTALAEDSFGAQSRDETLVTVELPPACP